MLHDVCLKLCECLFVQSLCHRHHIGQVGPAFEPTAEVPRSCMSSGVAAPVGSDGVVSVCICRSFTLQSIFSIILTICHCFILSPTLLQCSLSQHDVLQACVCVPIPSAFKLARSPRDWTNEIKSICFQARVSLQAPAHLSDLVQYPILRITLCKCAGF
jgi:hypothetical protein